MKRSMQGTEYIPQRITVRSSMQEHTGAVAFNYYPKNNTLGIKFLEPWKELVDTSALRNQAMNLDVVYERQVMSFRKKFDTPVDIQVDSEVTHPLRFKVDKKPLKCKLTIASKDSGKILAATKIHILKTGVGGSYIIPRANTSTDPDKLPWIVSIERNDRAYAEFDPYYQFELKDGNMKKTPGFYQFTGLFIFLNEVLHKLLLYEIVAKDSSDETGYSCDYAQQMFEGLKKVTKIDYPDGFDNGIISLKDKDTIERSDLDTWFKWIEDVCLALHQRDKKKEYKNIKSFLEDIAHVK